MVRNLRVSPQKLNLVAQMIRGKKVDVALADLEFSRKRIAQDVRKCVMSAVANAENNHSLDVNELVVTRGLRRQEHGDEAFSCPRPRPHEPDREAVCPADRSWCKAEDRSRRQSSRQAKETA